MNWRYNRSVSVEFQHFRIFYQIRTMQMMRRFYFNLPTWRPCVDRRLKGFSSTSWQSAVDDHRCWSLAWLHLSALRYFSLAYMCLCLTQAFYLPIPGMSVDIETRLYQISAPAPARIRHFFQIRLRQKSHRSRIVLTDLKSQFLECWMLDYLDLSCLGSMYCLHCCGVNYCVSVCKWCNGNCCIKNSQKLKSLVRS